MATYTTECARIQPRLKWYIFYCPPQEIKLQPFTSPTQCNQAIFFLNFIPLPKPKDINSFPLLTKIGQLWSIVSWLPIPVFLAFHDLLSKLAQDVITEELLFMGLEGESRIWYYVFRTRNQELTGDATNSTEKRFLLMPIDWPRHHTINTFSEYRSMRDYSLKALFHHMYLVCWLVFALQYCRKNINCI